MPYEQILYPQYRDADPDGLIGLKGAMHYFQDGHTWFMHAYSKGNDVLPEQYSAAWVYTRYRVALRHKMDYTDTLSLSTWMEPYHQPVLANIDHVLRQHGTIAAMGRAETCLISLVRQRPVRFSAIEFPDGVPEDIPNQIPDFIRLEKSAESMEEVYVHTVRVSDLDKSRHMNNLRYVDMFQDAFDSAFWHDFNPSDMEISFLSQCREGEAISVRSRSDADGLHFAALHEDGTLASVALFQSAART